MDGDAQLVQVSTAANTQALVVGQSATRIHPCLHGFATQQWCIRVEAGAVLLRLDRRGYSDLDVNLTWRPLETLSVSLRGDAIRSQLIDLAGDEVKEWRAALSLTWYPHPLTRSW